MVNLAIIGDVHRFFSQYDVDYFRASDYDLILIVGDLSNTMPSQGYRPASLIAQLNKPTLFIPGNHDAVYIIQLVAEIKNQSFISALFGLGQGIRADRLKKKLGRTQFCGYSSRPVSINNLDFDVIAARPYSMGGPNMNYKTHLKNRYGVNSIDASAEKLIKVVDGAKSNRLIFLAHNGPYGLGTSRSDIWGCDFLKEEGDNGDKDLQVAIDYALAQGKEVIAVVAGHMHHRLRGGGTRQWHVEREGSHYINAARVPRIYQRNGKTVHHHIRLSFDSTQIDIEEMLVERSKIIIF